MGLRAIYKLRVRKAYMDPALDSRLRAQRTLKEAKVLSLARERGVRVPRLYAVFTSMGLIVMEYVEGPTLKEVVGSPSWQALAEDAGLQLGLLHAAGIVHGGLHDFKHGGRGRGGDSHRLRPGRVLLKA